MALAKGVQLSPLLPGDEGSVATSAVRSNRMTTTGIMVSSGTVNRYEFTALSKFREYAGLRIIDAALYL